MPKINFKVLLWGGMCLLHKRFIEVNSSYYISSMDLMAELAPEGVVRLYGRWFCRYRNQK